MRGHSNVQGDRTMGICEKMPDEFLNRLGAEFAFSPPRRHGYDTVETIRAMHTGLVNVFVAMGGNFLSATPDTDFTAAALRKCRLTVQISTKLNRSHLITGQQALILPCLGRTERDMQAGGPQFVTTENSMAVVQTSRGTLSPASEHLRSEPWIVAGIAKATLAGHRHGLGWLGRELRSHPRFASSASSPASSDSTSACANPAASSFPIRRRDRVFATTHREGAVHGQCASLHERSNPVNF